MSIHDERAAVHLVHCRWAAGDLEGVMALFAEDVLHLVNVDGIAVPFAASSYGKEDLRQRLQLLMDTFHLEEFKVESCAHEPEFSRVVVRVRRTHKKTGERLRMRIRFRYWIRDGLIVRVEELLDASYVEAFQRFVLHVENAARSP